MAAAVLWLAASAAGTPPAGAFPYTLEWKRLAGDPPPAAVVESGDRVFFAEAGGAITALGRRDGLRLWRARPGGPVGPALAASGPRLLFADRWGLAGALSLETGQPLWSLRLRGRGSCRLAALDDLVLVHGGDGVLHALDAGTGHERWRLRTGLRPHSDPVLRNGKLLVAAAGRLLAVDPSTGRRLASHPVEGIRLLAAGPRAVFVAGGGSVRAFDGDLRPLWTRWLGTALAAPPVLAGGRLWCAGTNGFLYAFDPRQGEPRGSVDLGGRPTGPPVAAAAGVVVATGEGELIGVEADGRVLWRQRLAAGRAVCAAGAGRLYAAGDGRLHAFAPAPLRGAPGDTVWWEARAGGRKTGYGWRLWREQGDSLRLSEYAVGWRRGFVELRAESVLDARDLSVRRVSRARTDASQVLRTEVAASGAGLLVERRLGPGAERWNVPDPGGVTLAAAIPRRLARGPPRPGRRDTMLVLDPDSGVLRPVYARVGTTAAGETPVTLRFGPAVSPPPPAAGDLPPDLLPDLQVHLWLDEAGREIRAHAPALATAERRVGAGEALAWVRPEPGEPLRLDLEVPRPGRLDSLWIGWPAAPGAARRLFVLDGRQSLAADPSGSVLTVRRETLPEEGLSVSEVAALPALAPYRAPSLYIQSAAPAIRALAGRLVPDPGADSRDAARVLHDWVHDHMEPAHTDVRFKTSLEVLEDLRGTCSEYTVLFAALSRAAGIPARVSVGFAVSAAGELVPHIWPQVFVGEWLEVDPSWNAFPVEAAHVKTGQGLLHPAHLERLNLPLELIGAAAAGPRLVRFDAEGQPPSLALAESLHAAALEAERRFEDEAAQAARYELAALPLNRRSREVLTAIAGFHLERGGLEEAAWALDRLEGLDPAAADAVLYHRARLQEERGDPAGARRLLGDLVAGFPESDLADDALGRLAALVAGSEGCRRAGPLYRRLVETYAGSGWASVAASALRRCSEREALLEDAPPEPALVDSVRGRGYR